MLTMTMSASGDKADIPDPLSNVLLMTHTGHRHWHRERPRSYCLQRRPLGPAVPIGLSKAVAKALNRNR
jgi:hypothetical protein